MRGSYLFLLLWILVCRHDTFWIYLDYCIIYTLAELKYFIFVKEISSRLVIEAWWQLKMSMVFWSKSLVWKYALITIKWTDFYNLKIWSYRSPFTVKCLWHDHMMLQNVFEYHMMQWILPKYFVSKFKKCRKKRIVSFYFVANSFVLVLSVTCSHTFKWCLIFITDHQNEKIIFFT